MHSMLIINSHLKRLHFLHIHKLSSFFIVPCNVECRTFAPTFQMFSAMASYDLGCTHNAGADSVSVLLNAGLSFMSNTMKEHQSSKSLKMFL